MPEEIRPDEVEELMKKIGAEAPRSAPPPAAARESSPARMEFEPLVPAGAPHPEASLDLLGDVDVNLKVELGRTRLYVQDILRLGPGSVVTLDSLTSEPLDVYVNDRLVARGEVLVVNENLAIRITEVVTPQKAPEK